MAMINRAMSRGSIGNGAGSPPPARGIICTPAEYPKAGAIPRCVEAVTPPSCAACLLVRRWTTCRGVAEIWPERLGVCCPE